MLDAIKFAFEILIVGALALPWLAIVSRMVASGPASGLPSYLSVVPRSARGTVAVAVVIAFGYVAGSAVSRISRDLFNDELLRKIPTEDRIRDGVYQFEYCGQDLVDMDMYLPFYDNYPLSDKASLADRSSLSAMHQKLRIAFCPGGKAQPERIHARIKEMFSLQEGELLLQGQDKVDRLKQYYDQITVLRGAALNGFILFVVCGFGSCGNMRARWSETRILKFITFLPAGFLILYGCYSLLVHFSDKSQSPYSNPPLAECVLVLLGAFGLFVTSKAEKAPSYYRTCALAAMITLISFGGWWWTEVMYDLQVVHSQPELHPIPPASPNGSENQK